MFLEIEGSLYHCMNGNFSSSVEKRIDPKCVKNLNKICDECDAGIVITSTYRIGKTTRELQKMLSRHGFSGKVIGKTPKTNKGSGFEILTWLTKHPQITYDKYIIIDQRDVEPDLGCQIKTDYYGGGLNDSCTERAIRTFEVKGQK